jgi:uncharacterized repeat protein (TIGR03847 family)
MSSYLFDLKPCSRLTIGTIGPAGQRTFYLQGVQGRTVVSLIIEKQHAQALAASIEELLEEVEAKYPADYAPETASLNMSLIDPITPRFRVGRLGLGYDAEEDMLFVFAQELLTEEEAEGREPAVGRLWATREQMAALGSHAKKVAAAGRPICALCGNPIDPDGHFCPPSNGHHASTILQ